MRPADGNVPTHTVAKAGRSSSFRAASARSALWKGKTTARARIRLAGFPAGLSGRFRSWQSSRHAGSRRPFAEAQGLDQDGHPAPRLATTRRISSTACQATACPYRYMASISDSIPNPPPRPCRAGAQASRGAWPQSVRLASRRVVVIRAHPFRTRSSAADEFSWRTLGGDGLIVAGVMLLAGVGAS